MKKKNERYFVKRRPVGLAGFGVYDCKTGDCVYSYTGLGSKIKALNTCREFNAREAGD